MLLNKILKPGEVNEVNRVGQFIKIMNCENTLQLRATQNGKEVITTDAKAGFELATSQAFDQLILESETEQKIEIWVSRHKLNYDALSTKASRSYSFIAEHFGLSQQILPYDPAQSGVKVALIDRGFWVGGEGVTDETGIYIPQGEVYKHDSAAPLHAYIQDKPDLVLDSETYSVVPVAGDEQARLGIVNGDYLGTTNSLNYFRVYNTITGEKLSLSGMNNPCAYKDGWIGLNSSSNNEIRIINGAGETFDILNPYRSEFIPQAFVESDGGVLIFGKSTNHSSYDSRILYYKDGVFSERSSAALFKSNDVSLAFRDSVDGSIWVSIDGDWHQTNDDGLAISAELILMGVGSQHVPTFSSKYITACHNSKALVRNRTTGEIIDVRAKLGSVIGLATIGETLVALVGDKMYVSEDGFETYNLAYTHDTVFADYLFNVFTVSGNELIAWVNDSTKTEMLKFQLTPDLTNPKAKFRVFKESF